ncbi:hypothetical protein B0H14DRAFT_2752891, partial [Mycena olivaceomarginata]
DPEPEDNDYNDEEQGEEQGEEGEEEPGSEEERPAKRHKGTQGIHLVLSKSPDPCWVPPEDGKHVALGHPHSNTWAAAWAHGTSDEETPPNHAIFSSSNSGHASKSLLQRRAAAATNQASTAAGPTIHTHNNFTIPDGFLDLFRPAAVRPVASQHPAPIAQPYEPQLTLIPPGMNVGPQMPITTFCVIASLDDTIAEKFAANGYRTMAAFRFIELKDLPLIQFLPGEIAELREAVREWAVAT